MQLLGIYVYASVGRSSTGSNQFIDVFDSWESINCNSVLIDDIGLSIALCYFVKLNAMCQLQSEDLRLGNIELLNK